MNYSDPEKTRMRQMRAAHKESRQAGKHGSLPERNPEAIACEWIFTGLSGQNIGGDRICLPEVFHHSDPKCSPCGDR